MTNDDRLSAHLQDRPANLLAAKERGVKIVGYLPGNFVPEEIIYAAGAIPLCLSEGGNLHAAQRALSVVPNILCPFARTQVAEMKAKTNPYYTMVDVVVAPITCQHVKKVAEVWEYQGDVEVFKLGVPHESGDEGLEYYAHRLRVLAERLGKVTGQEVTDEGLKGAIDLYDRLRSRLKKISLLRRGRFSPVSTRDFVNLHHTSFVADPAFMVEELDRFREGLRTDRQSKEKDKPRLLLMGPNLANGDIGILNLIEAAGGSVVVEEFFEGMRHYWQEVGTQGNPVDSLAKSYLRRRLPPAFMRASTRRRLDFVLKLVEDFHVSGVVWYELLCCETYDQESYFFFRELAKRGVPMLIVESDYSPLDTGPLRTRLDAFMELVTGGPVNG